MEPRAEHGGEANARLTEDIRLLRQLLRPEDEASESRGQAAFRQAVQNIIDARQSELTQQIRGLQPMSRPLRRSSSPISRR